MMISKRSRVLPVLWILCAAFSSRVSGSSFERRWTYVSETSAVIYWQLADIAQSAVGRVEYGTTQALGQSTETTRRARWSHLHHLTGLTPGATYHYRMVAVDTLTRAVSESEILSFTTAVRPDAIRIPGDLDGPPYILDRPGGYYILTEDIKANGTAIRIEADSVTLDLDGRTVTFGDDTSSQVYGVQFVYRGQATLCNGRIAQGARSGLYSCAVRSSDRPHPTEIFGISTDVHLKCAYPLNFLRAANRVRVHHNHFYSRVTDLESRHYPGNAILQMGITGGEIQIHDNLLTEGCHRGIALSGDGTVNVEVYHNDVQHHMQYTNGYALIPCENAVFRHNRVTSSGRGAHLLRPGIQFHDNYIDTSTHQERDDLPQNVPEMDGGNPDQHRFNMHLVEAHGIKFEGSNVRNCRVYNNYVRMVQRLPNDSGGRGAPEDKMDNGVYVNGSPTSAGATSLTDNAMSWQRNRWQGYFLRYSDAAAPAYILENSSSTLTAYLDGAPGPDYTIYQKWQYVPPTPLNIGGGGVDANNEVYDNTFIALTEYEDGSIRHGGYGDTGNWASTIMFVGMNGGASPAGQHNTRIYNNTFISNDLFMNSYEDVTNTIKVENNVFRLEGAPHVINRASRLRAIGAGLENTVNLGGNRFALDATIRNPDINGDGRVNILDVLTFALLRRNQPDSPINDWNVDGRVDSRDLLALLRDVIAFRRSDTASASDRPVVPDSVSVMNEEQHAELLSFGRDAL